MTDTPAHMRSASVPLPFMLTRQPEAGSMPSSPQDRIEEVELLLRKTMLKASRDAEQMADLEQQMERLQHDVVELSRALIRESRLREALQRDIADREEEIVELRNSTSWRITGPLRSLRLVLARRG